MVAFRYGGKEGAKVRLEVDDSLVVVRTARATPLARFTPLTPGAQEAVLGLDSVVAFPFAGVEVLRSRQADAADVRVLLKSEDEVRFAGRCLADPVSGAPVVYSENLFVKFHDAVDDTAARQTLARHGVNLKRALGYAPNSYFAGAPEGTGQAVFDIAAALLAEDAVELCHPELIREAALRGAFPQQWHLHETEVKGRRIDAHASVVAAWALSHGEGTVIAVIDDGVDVAHEEFASGGKVVAPRDVTRKVNAATPGPHGHHGTACAGVACADGLFGASGVAPKARLMPIRLASGLGSQAEADAFVWAAEHGADVISCSWGPPDGIWFRPDDPLHNTVVPLPDSTRLAIDFATNRGRGGKGCVIAWAAGNGNESVDNDGYASYARVIAVAACNDQSRRSAYSDWGNAVWCAFPSSHGAPSLTPGIWTTDRTGPVGYNAGNPQLGDAAGNYTHTFGGTSSSCPGVAGAAALVLARNPDLTWQEVKEILRASADRIDEAGGAYDPRGHSRFYGYGRVNVEKAARLAVPERKRYTAVHTGIQDVEIQDLKTSTLAVQVGDEDPVKDIRVSVDIAHTFIGDLVVTLAAPAAAGIAGPAVLHDRAGGGMDDIKTTYTAQTTPALGRFIGINPKGTWTLEVTDKAAQDEGTIRSFSVLLEL